MITFYFFKAQPNVQYFYANPSALMAQDETAVQHKTRVHSCQQRGLNLGRFDQQPSVIPINKPAMNLSSSEVVIPNELIRINHEYSGQ